MSIKPLVRGLVFILGLMLLSGAAFAQVGTPVASYPKDNCYTSRCPQFCWSLAEEASTYQIWIREAVSNQTVIQNWAGVANTWSPTVTELTPGTRYEWFVRGWNTFLRISGKRGDGMRVSDTGDTRFVVYCCWEKLARA